MLRRLFRTRILQLNTTKNEGGRTRGRKRYSRKKFRNGSRYTNFSSFWCVHFRPPLFVLLVRPLSSSTFRPFGASTFVLLVRPLFVLLVRPLSSSTFRPFGASTFRPFGASTFRRKSMPAAGVEPAPGAPTDRRAPIGRAPSPDVCVFVLPRVFLGQGARSGTVLGDFRAPPPRPLPLTGVGSKSRGECKNSLRFSNGPRVEKFGFSVDPGSCAENPHMILVRKGQLCGVLKTISDGDRNLRRGRQKTSPKTAQNRVRAKNAKKQRKSRFRPPLSAF